MLRTFACHVVGVALAVSGGVAAAQTEDLRPRAALAACAAGDVPRGIAILAELYAEGRDPSYVFNQARCYQQNGQFEAARVRFAEYLRIGQHEPPADIQRAEAFIREIDETTARQRRPETLVAPVPSAPAPDDRERDPHTPDPPPRDTRARSLRVAGIALGVVGLAAVATGAVMSLKVRAVEDDVEAGFAAMPVVTDPAALQRQLSDGGRYETWQWISYGVGVAALAGAATTFALGGWPRASTRGGEAASVTLAPRFSPNELGGVLRLGF